MECFFFWFLNLTHFEFVDFPRGELSDFLGEIDGCNRSVFEVPLVLFFRQILDVSFFFVFLCFGAILGVQILRLAEKVAVRKFLVKHFIFIKITEIFRFM